MQYEFVDTVEPEEEPEKILPAEAMQFNGKYLEDAIDGYRTLYVRGRESMLAEINAYETGVRDGTGITSKRFPARELVIGYLLKADTNEAFREAYNALNGILNTQDAQIIFHDEEDKYFTGTPEGLDEIEAGRNFVQGEIIIYCADPFKYSVEEIINTKEVTSTGVGYWVEYNGTYRVRPVLEADFTCDCGYVSWMLGGSGPRIQLGDMGESDGENYTYNTLLVNQKFNDLSKLDGWEQNVKYIWLDDGEATGSRYEAYGGTFAISSSDYLYPGSFAYQESAMWSGACISRKFSETASSWNIIWTMRMEAGTGSYDRYRGGMEVIMLDDSDELVAGVGFYQSLVKGSVTGRIRVHTKTQSTIYDGIDFSNGNSRFGEDAYCWMENSGSTISFNLSGLSYTLKDSAIANAEIARVVVTFLNVGDFLNMTTGLYDMSVYKHGNTGWRNLSNSFAENDVAIADCKSGAITLNGSEAPSYGIISNKWESFYLEPGNQYIWFNRSSWVSSSDVTTSKIRWHEVYV